ncbi:class I SAM-dependent methyltransferase [Pontivivens nitratireducens]|uniref:Class I SAM-dependent methyltransferase n=1 Tax=Pontivivens nitratireducens TaxID=2758038 RepID=A0A6G7VQM9_9RHOB|nr:class I SAM-dependent methyltransferase [Pontibrevibacter nitratireducens]QIK42321.1 class I SAM-dependent methyltransferase [Pontibrevibacter nitratireducens]
MSTLSSGPNLTDLADKYGSDKGSGKHRYTELYHMLFSPFRNRKITFLEMGLLIGGPEHGKDADRQTTDLPSIRMWLDYFTKARIVGLDVSDFSWFEHDRFDFVRCDMDDRANINEAIGRIGAPDIVIDDASHASHHQQNAFLEIFPLLPSGGLYIIEDLRWQPPPYEKAGITKTAALFQSWLHQRTFEHSDPTVAEQFNALAPDISGCFVFQAGYKKARRDQVAVIHKR